MIGQELGKTGHEPNPDLPDGFQMVEPSSLPKEWRVVRLGNWVVWEILLTRNGFPQGHHNELFRYLSMYKALCRWHVNQV